MKHSFIPSTVVSFAMLCALGIGASTLNSPGRAAAAVRPAPTPTPVAIAYDEINRMAFAQVTPPPVGAFGEDYQRIMAAAQNAQADRPPQPHGLGGMISQAMGAAQNPESMENPMDAMQNGTLKRYTFYWVRGWIRVDDPVAHTATIYKCKEHQIVYLDLAKKTYRIASDTDSNQASSDNDASSQNPYLRRMAQPGTATMTVTANASALGPKVVEGIPTHGYDSTNAIAIANATGSCRNGSFSSHVVEYVSNINEQRAYCPIPGRPSDGSRYGGPAGGCKPTVSVHQAGSARAPANKLAMYRMSSFGAGGGQGGAMVLERGHVTWLYNSDIPALFNPPADFTQQS